eukprot:1152275-Pelagomonas_calceolata.AAC.2
MKECPCGQNIQPEKQSAAVFADHAGRSSVTNYEAVSYGYVCMCITADDAAKVSTNDLLLSNISHEL